ncbi:hypothetical protein JCM9492_00580 [Aquifex pyrophilus]
MAKKPIKEILDKCMTKVEEHYKLKELYQQLSQGLNVEDVLQETVEDYKEKMEKYILEVLEEIKRCEEMAQSLRTEQKEEAVEELRECEKDLYCTIAELFELYHFFRELETLSKEQLNEAVSIPVDIVYELFIKLNKS